MAITDTMEGITADGLLKAAQSLNASVAEGWLEQAEGTRRLRSMAANESPVLMISETADAMLGEALEHFGGGGDDMREAFAATAIRMFLWGLHYGRAEPGPREGTEP